MGASHRNDFYLSLGSNIGDRQDYLDQSIRLLNETSEITITQKSSTYETDPVGYEDQDRFLNRVVKGETFFPPEKLLQHILDAERLLGRQRSVRWGPRTVDIDILLYNSISMCTKHLEIPHPRMQERGFVLVPLAEIAPNLIIPGTTYTAEELCQKVKGEGVHLWKSKS